MTRADKDLTADQAKKVFAAIQPALGFLNRLEQRLAELGFPPNGGYAQRVTTARDALHDLTVATHYLSLTHGVGRPNRP